jgi:putative spermidine/putrescine transport system substrate-binding protein
MEWSLNPKSQGDIAAWFGSVPAVPEACLSSDLLTDTGCGVNGFDNFAKIAFWKTPSTDCGNGKNDCVPYSDWTTAYLGIKGK